MRSNVRSSTCDHSLLSFIDIPITDGISRENKCGFTAWKSKYTSCSYVITLCTSASASLASLSFSTRLGKSKSKIIIDHKIDKKLTQVILGKLWSLRNFITNELHILLSAPAEKNGFQMCQPLLRYLINGAHQKYFLLENRCSRINH